jgi:hypothetical protein
MLREKIFLSIVFLVLSMMTGVACLPLFAVLVPDPIKVSQLGTGVLLALPLISLGLLWRAQPDSNYGLRRYSFLAWAVVLMTIGVSNMLLFKEHNNSHRTIIMLAAVCVAISLHANNKSKKIPKKSGQ